MVPLLLQWYLKLATAQKQTGTKTVARTITQQSTTNTIHCADMRIGGIFTYFFIVYILQNFIPIPFAIKKKML